MPNIIISSFFFLIQTREEKNQEQYWCFKMGGFERVLDCFSMSCLCMSSVEDEDDYEKKALVVNDQMIQLKQLLDGNKTLAFHLEPKTVVLKVSMHCHGCARKVEKHISKIEGVTSFEVDLERKKVVVTGDITPFEILQSVSKVKFAELWVSPPHPLPTPLKYSNTREAPSD